MFITDSVGRKTLIASGNEYFGQKLTMKKFIVMTLVLMMTTGILFSQSTPKGLMVGDTAPDFTSTDQNGKTVNLKSLLRDGPVVLVFYRGEWCPYCNKYLKQLEDSLPMLTRKGAKVVTVSPEKSENIAKTVKKTKATYSIIHDDGLTIMKAYDVSYPVDESTILRYKKYGIDLQSANGDNGANLPVPAVYIISETGRVTYRFFNWDYKIRASVKEILRSL